MKQQLQNNISLQNTAETDEDPLFNIAFENAQKLFIDGNVKESQGACEGILLQYPDNVMIRYSLGIIYIDLEKFIDAEECLEEGLEMEPNNSNIMSLLGVAKCGTFELDEAVKLTKIALEIDPCLENQIRYAYVLRTSGDFEKAIPQLRKILETKKDYAPAYLGLAEMGCLTKDTPELTNLLELNKRPGNLTLRDKATIKFALGKAFYDLKEYEDSFNYYKEANNIRQKTSEVPEHFVKSLEKDTKEIINAFTPEVIQNLQGLGHSTDKPIFIIGMPRSGTTLIEQILSSHQDVDSAGEISALMDASPLPADIESIKDKILGVLLSKQFKDMGDNYLHIIEKLSDNKHIINKLPLNYFWVGIIRLVLPNAKIIHCARNPMDTGLSAYRQDFINDIIWSNNLKMLGHVYNSYDDIMQHWYKLFPNNIYHAQYEEIVQNPEKHIRSLIEFCDLEWNDACLEFHKSKTNIRTASVYQARQPVYTSSLKGWKKFEKQLQPLYQIVKDRMPKED